MLKIFGHFSGRSLALTLVGAGISIVGGLISDAKLDMKLDEKVEKEVAKQLADLLKK